MENALTDILDKFEDSISVTDFTISWSAKGVGFGEFSFYTEDGVLHCDNECMSKHFIMSTLIAMVEKAQLTNDIKDKKET